MNYKRFIQHTIALLLTFILTLMPLTAGADGGYTAADALQAIMSAISPMRGEDEVTFTTLDEIIDYLEEETRALNTTIRFRYSGDKLFELFEDDDRHYDLIANIAGVIEYSYNNFKQGDHYYFLYDDIVYPSGFITANAHLNGDESSLSSAQRRMLQIAQRIASDAVAQSDDTLGREIFIHDAICSLTTYELSATEDETCYNDTAEGVLLYGLAECDGYADAFYLIGTLAGLKIGYQCGTCRSDDEDEYGGHIWNTICIDDKWYFVDLTWDDIADDEYPAVYSYAYCNVGISDLRDHKWDGTVVAHKAEYSRTPEYYPYTSQFYDNGSYGAYFDNINEAARYVAGNYMAGVAFSHIMIAGELDDRAFQDAIEQAMTFVWDDWSNVYWSSRFSGNTCVELLFDSLEYENRFELYKTLFAITLPLNTGDAQNNDITQEAAATAAPESDDAPKSYLRTTTNVNVRTGPGTGYESMGVASEGTRIVYLGETRQDNSGMEWRHVEYNGRDGWVAAKYTSIE